MNILVSACLLGIACKYSGGDNACPALLQALRQSGHTLIPVCPEVYGGLPTPRHRRISGDGLTAALLKANGVQVYNEDTFAALL